MGEMWKRETRESIDSYWNAISEIFIFCTLIRNICGVSYYLMIS